MQLAEAAVNSQGQNRQQQKSNIRGMSLGLPVSYGLESWVKYGQGYWPHDVLGPCF